MIDNGELLQSKVAMVEALANVQLGARVIGQMDTAKPIHPIDVRPPRLLRPRTPALTSTTTLSAALVPHRSPQPHH